MTSPPTQPPKPNLVVIGGGTGTSVVLNGLKHRPVNLHTIITVTDSGGSTGRLRDEFGFAPVGDLRQAIAALAVGQDRSWIKDLLLYRFDKGSGLKGHNLGNLILTALQDITGSTAKAVTIASHIFRVNGHIYPITTKDIHLVIEYQDGTIEIGEDILDLPKHGGKKIVGIKTSPRATIYPPAKVAIETADYIIIGPGDLYGSILPNLVVAGTTRAFKHSRAKIIYVVNLMTRYSQTHNMSAADHLSVLEKYLRHPVDVVILNTAPIPSSILNIYRRQHEYPVLDDLRPDPHRYIIRAPLIHTRTVARSPADKVPRSYLRHHPGKIGQVLLDIVGL